MALDTAALKLTAVDDVYVFLIWPATVYPSKFNASPSASVTSTKAENVEPWSTVRLEYIAILFLPIIYTF